MPATRAAQETEDHELDVVIVGAGFGGLYALHRLRGLGLRVRVLEAGDGVGGTWYWNRYPGARCDVESIDYSYSFDEQLQQEWVWSERFATQPEILRYIEHVVERFDLARDIRLSTRVTSARWDEAGARWQIGTENGARLVARYCVMAMGNLTAVNAPPFPGLDRFAGTTLHSARWPAEGVDFTGRRVGIVGTGSTAIQMIPLVAESAEHLLVFQRTPNFSMPARNRPWTPDALAAVKRGYAERRARASRSPAWVPLEAASRSLLDASEEERHAAFMEGWREGGSQALMAQFRDVMTDERANGVAAEFARDRIRELVHDPATAELLCPKDYALGGKRVCVDSGYYETYNRENVTLVDVRSAPIRELTPTGLRTEAGEEFAFDTLILATGFDAMTGALLAVDPVGRDGLTLREAWAEGPQTYLGLSVAGFPNMFIVAGPGSPSVLTNMVAAVEQHGDWIAECITTLDARDVTAIEATREAQEDWVAHNEQVAAGSMRTQGNSWWQGANIPGKPRVFMVYLGGAVAYRERCDAVAAAGYDGFTLSTGTSRDDRALIA